MLTNALIFLVNTVCSLFVVALLLRRGFLVVFLAAIAVTALLRLLT